MKQLSVFFLSTIIILMACGSGDDFMSIQKDSRQYAFFKELSEDVPMVNPDKNVKFIKTNEFELNTKNLLFYLYQEMYKESGGKLDNFKTLTHASLEKFIKDVALNLAERHLILIDAKAHHIEVLPDSVDSLMQRLYRNKNGKENFIEQEVNPRGVTLEYIQNDARDNLIIQKYYKEVVFGDIKYDEDEVRKIYLQDKKATIRHLFLITKGKSEQEKKRVRQKMETILQKAKTGADFAELAKEYSEDIFSKSKGGLLEDFKRGTYLTEIDEAAFNLPIGGISDIIESKNGYHLVKVIERKGDPRPYEVAREQIIAQLTAKQRREAVARFSKEIKEKYELEIIENPGDEIES